jgi:hypothetical protein
MKRWLLLFVLLVSACSSTPTAPAPVVPACQTNNTATVAFGNRTTSNLTFDVVWDGVRIGTIAPTLTSPSQTAAAGVPHVLRFQVTNTTLLACNQSTPTLAQCSTQTLTCGA